MLVFFPNSAFHVCGQVFCNGRLRDERGGKGVVAGMGRSLVLGCSMGRFLVLGWVVVAGMGRILVLGLVVFLCMGWVVHLCVPMCDVCWLLQSAQVAVARSRPPTKLHQQH